MEFPALHEILSRKIPNYTSLKYESINESPSPKPFNVH